MRNVERLSITVPTDMARQIRAMVEDDGYASHSEVIREAFRVWQGSGRRRTRRLASVRAKIDEADADPRPSLTEAEVDRHFEQRLKRSLTSLKDDA